MKILGINPGHNGSAAYVVDGETVFYIEEERLSRQKYDGNPFRGILKAIETGVDVLVLGGTSPERHKLDWTGEDSFTALVRKFNPSVKILNMGGDHHLGHAAVGFYNSGFETAAAVIVDGAGSHIGVSGQDGEPIASGFETETITKCSYPASFDVVYKSLGNNFGTIKQPIDQPDLSIMDTTTITKAYEAVSDYLGFGFIEAGKTMGLAPYGKENSDLPDFFINGKGNKNLLTPVFPAGAIINESSYPELKRQFDPREWHRDPSLVPDVAKDLAYKIQNETQELVGDLIQKAYDVTGEKNIVVSGGYALNCMANYYLQERFPELNIYVEPISHDGGTALGLAKLVHYKETDDSTIRPQTTLYYGLSDSNKYDTLNECDDVVQTDSSDSDVAKLISEKNIVALFQGRSEAGPRALGNRSILYDPRDPNGKDHVNRVKGREWFRPFAGSMLANKFSEWFETHGLTESPFMMYAMDFKLEKHGEVPAITHVDGTCRIQTVTLEQNENYYNLIHEFYELTGVPILFNTSFNLAGEPLVETLEDAIHTCRNSEIDYLYLPEIGKLIEIKSD